MNRFADPGLLVRQNIGINPVNCSLVGVGKESRPVKTAHLAPVRAHVIDRRRPDCCQRAKPCLVKFWTETEMLTGKIAEKVDQTCNAHEQMAV